MRKQVALAATRRPSAALLSMPVSQQAGIVAVCIRKPAKLATAMALTRTLRAATGTAYAAVRSPRPRISFYISALRCCKRVMPYKRIYKKTGLNRFNQRILKNFIINKFLKNYNTLYKNSKSTFKVGRVIQKNITVKHVYKMSGF